MKRGTKTKIAQHIKKSVSFVCQYFRGQKRMSWNTALLAHNLYPMIKPELWMNQDLTEIERKISEQEASI